MVDVAHVATFIINYQSEDDPDLTHLKLQKLLYYCQGYFLAAFGQRLFADAIEAWDHGPVVKSVYQKYSGQKNAILEPDHNNPVDLGLADEQQRLLIDVLEEYGQFSAWTLREMTHEEQPWNAAYAQGKNTALSDADMAAFFKTQLKPS